MAKTGAFATASRLFLPELKLKGGALYEVEPASESRPQYHPRLYTVEYRNEACSGPVVMSGASIDDKRAIGVSQEQSTVVRAVDLAPPQRRDRRGKTHHQYRCL